jgi:ABC-type multidrug transport system fused ATPase/permease subunit
MVSVDRIYKLSEIPQEKESTDSDELNLQLLKQDWPQHGKVVFDNVSLKYRQNTEIVLNDLTFEIFPKEKIGIVGRTGAGKSTICLSLSRIMEICNG